MNTVLTQFIESRKKQEIPECLAVYCWYATKIKRRGTLEEFRLFAEWLGCYVYITPPERRVSSKLNFAALEYFDGDLTRTYFSLLSIDTNLTLRQQDILADLINKQLETRNG